MSEVARRRLGVGFWGFIVLMLALTALFVSLGVWQLNRLKEKEALIAKVAERQTLPPYPMPAGDELPALDAEVYAYHQVTLSGVLHDEQSVLVFTGLSEPKGKFSGPGYWVMTPMVLDEGGVVFVNRGFVPQASGAQFASGHGTPEAPRSFVGLALPPELAAAFTPGTDAAKRIDWVRDPARLAKLIDPALGPVAPIYVDAPAGEPGALPQGGETVIEFPNNHLGYAFTWFGFAIITPILLLVWIWRQVRPRSAEANTAG